MTINAEFQLPESYCYAKFDDVIKMVHDDGFYKFE